MINLSSSMLITSAEGGTDSINFGWFAFEGNKGVKSMMNWKWDV